MILQKRARARWASRILILASALFSSALQAEMIDEGEAVRRVLAAAPETAATTARLDALGATRQQAGVKPNPTLEVYSENFLGTGNEQFVDGAEVTASYAQTLERGGKRRARVVLADREIGIAEAEAVVMRLEIAARAQKAYNEAVTADALLAVAEERLQTARALATEVQRRVNAARDPLFAGTRAATRVEEAVVDVELAEHAREAALMRLAALWGGNSENLEVAAKGFYRVEDNLTISNAIAAADLAVQEAYLRRAEAAIDLERARQVQDPTVRGGVRYLNRTSDVAFVAGVSIPLARFDTNRANVLRAEAERRQAIANIEVTRVTRMRDLRLVREIVEETRHEALAIRDRILPGAEKTLRQVREGYARGGFRHADIDEAARALTIVRERLAAAAASHWEARVRLDRLTGRYAAIRLPEELRP